MNHSPSTLEKLRKELLDSVDRYFQALYEGDVSELRQSFHPRARYATVVEGAPLILDLEEYLAVVAKRQSPRERGDDRRYVVSQSQLAGSTAALVALQSCMLGKEFTD
ncbi:MAG: nuclear transport factor 2 family protein, partial [Candidatus Sumerlaeia bacterium]|nr:nuclear transport factor 2 family protein [Candidatus Sumerlaeia bacterium]